MVLKELQNEIEEFLKRTGMSRAAFGLAALNDASFTRRLLDHDTDVKVSTVERCREYMNDLS